MATKKDTTIITNIELKIGDHTIKLSLEALKELKDILNKLLPEPVVVEKIIKETIKEKEYVPFHTDPIWYEPQNPPWHKHTVWCGQVNPNDGTLQISYLGKNTVDV